MKKTNVARILDQHKIDYRLFDKIFFSAGVRGTQVKISPEDLIRMTNPGIGKISV